MFDEFGPIDTDTHITEPPDVWTARVSKKWGDAVPHIKRVGGMDMWFVRDQVIHAPGWVTMAGFDGSYPEHPQGFDDIPKSSFDAHERLKHMDREGIQAQVLYPNVGGFGAGGFLKLGEPELMLECVRAYNDFLVEWCSADKKRLLPGAAIPFWDVKESVKEIHRAASIGHKTVLACTAPGFRLPALAPPALGSVLGCHRGNRPARQFPYRRRRHRRQLHRRSLPDGTARQYRRRIDQAVPGKSGLSHRYPVRRRVPPLSETEAVFGRERDRLGTVIPRILRLAIRQYQRAQGTSGIQTPAQRIFQTSDPCELLVRRRERGHRKRHPRAAGQHHVGNGFPPSNVAIASP